MAKAARRTMPQHSRTFHKYAGQVHKHGNLGISSAHDARHVQTVASYAGKMSRFLGASSHVAAQSEISGYTHDRIRLSTEKLSNREEAITVLKKEFPGNVTRDDIGKLVDAELARKAEGPSRSDYGEKDRPDRLSSDDLTAVFLRDKLEKRLGKKAAARVINAIIFAGKLPGKTRYMHDLVHTPVVYADKWFEANGAFIAFRRSYFMAERADRREEFRGYLERGVSRRNAMRRIVLNETAKRLKAYSDLTKVPKRFHKFLQYQIDWQKRFQTGLNNRSAWAMNLMETLFEEGLKRKPRSLEQTIREYAPVGTLDRQFRDETLRYFNGDLWKEFTKRVKAPPKRK